MNKALLAAVTGTALIGTGAALAEPTRMIVTIENLAPANATAQTPHWVGFHDGAGIDIYNGGTPASSLPIPGSVAVERLAEDGNTDPITQDFALLSPNGVDGVITGPNGPLRPGEIGSAAFLLESANPNHRFFSYASMVLPSNDFWYANGNPQTHVVFDENGNFIAQDFFVTRDDILDAGTEVNTEVPEQTAFFGQTTANTGVDENRVIRDFDPADPETYFLRPGSGGVLDSAGFRMADFLAEGYPLVKISFTRAPAIVDELKFKSTLSGDEEVLLQIPTIAVMPRSDCWTMVAGSTITWYRTFRSIGCKRTISTWVSRGRTARWSPYSSTAKRRTIDRVANTGIAK
jgi:hypothetical protein